MFQPGARAFRPSGIWAGLVLVPLTGRGLAPLDAAECWCSVLVQGGANLIRVVSA